MSLRLCQCRSVPGRNRATGEGWTLTLCSLYSLLGTSLLFCLAVSTYESHVVHAFLQSLETRIEEGRRPFHMSPTGGSREGDSGKTEGPHWDTDRAEEEVAQTRARSLDLYLGTHDSLYVLQSSHDSAKLTRATPT